MNYYRRTALQESLSYDKKSGIFTLYWSQGLIEKLKK
jgi:hypothetical protein